MKIHCSCLRPIPDTDIRLRLWQSDIPRDGGVQPSHWSPVTRSCLLIGQTSSPRWHDPVSVAHFHLELSCPEAGHCSATFTARTRGTVSILTPHWSVVSYAAFSLADYITPESQDTNAEEERVKVSTFKLQTGMVSQFYRRSQILWVYFENDLHLDLSNLIWFFRMSLLFHFT